MRFDGSPPRNTRFAPEVPPAPARVPGGGPTAYEPSGAGSYLPGPLARAKRFLKRHEKKLWWAHTAWALGVGTSVVFFAQKGFERARFLALSVVGAWLLVVLFFRLQPAREPSEVAEVRSSGATFRVYAMSYALKNLYQGMLFFLLPFYWKSTTFFSKTTPFFCLVLCCALASTVDLLFDRVLLRFRALASTFHAVTLFACMNLVVPALVPHVPTVWSLAAAGFVAAASFFTMHLDRRSLRRAPVLGAALLVSLASGGAAYALREVIPPVPAYVARAGVGPFVLADGRLAMEVVTLRAAAMDKLVAVTEISIPAGKREAMHHVWRHDGVEVRRATETTSRTDAPEGIVRLRSTLSGHELPRDPSGRWSVDVETEDGQLLGRTGFRVVD